MFSAPIPGPGNGPSKLPGPARAPGLTRGLLAGAASAGQSSRGASRDGIIVGEVRAQNGTSSAALMKRATTFLTPAFSKSISILSPSMPTTAP